MNAIVIGSTGLTGSALLRQLSADPNFDHIISLQRRSLENPLPNVEEIIVDFDHPESWPDKVRGDVLFSALGTTLKKAGSKKAQYKVDYTYQLEVARIAARNGVRKYILVSAAMANPKSRIFYSRMKGELEEAIKKLPFEKIYILRPGLIHGPRPDKRPLEGLSARVMTILSRLPGLSLWRPLSGEELARAMKQLALTDPCIFKICVVTQKEIIKLASEAKSY